VWLFELKLVGGTLALVVSAWLVYRRFRMPSSAIVSRRTFSGR
jgi:hypothetical protein